MSSRPLFVAALVAAVPGVSGCKSTVVRRAVERRIEKRLAEDLGPAEKYRVRIRDTPDGELVLGRARHVEVEGRRVFAMRQLQLESLRLSLVDLRYERGETRFVSVRRSELEVEFTDTALNDYLRANQARYQPSVRFEPGTVQVRMTYLFLGTPTPIGARGRFVIEEGRRLLFDAESVDVSFLNQPGFGERFVEDRVNPLLDLGKIDFPARLESVQVLQGRIRALGSATIRRPVE